MGGTLGRCDCGAQHGWTPRPSSASFGMRRRSAAADVGWQEVGELLERVPRRDERYEAARWALDSLQDQLGDHWLKRAADLGDDGVPFALDRIGWHNQALAEALEWALRLELCQRWEGSADFMRDLVNDPRPSRLLHSRSQLAQASLAERLGWPVVLEPGSRPPSDLVFVAPSGKVITEIRVLTQSDFGRQQREVAEGVTDWLFGLGLEHGVWIGGQFGREPGPTERRQIEEFVRRESARVRAGEKPRFFGADISLEISDRDATAPALVSPPVREELFGRMIRAIAEKAEKMTTSGAQWLHVTALTGLWAFTSWGRGPLAEKLPAMLSALTGALSDHRPAGIVLTSGAALVPGEIPEEIAQDKQGFAVRSLVEPLRGRESLVMPLRKEAQQASKDWLSITRSERDWLTWALAQRGLPRLPALLRPSAT